MPARLSRRKGGGDSDDRWQWPTMLRIIQDVAPTWIVFENVSNLINFGKGILFDGILTDMEDAGYETATFILPACSRNAPHRRDRVFVVGISERGRTPQQKGSIGDKRGRSIDSSQRDVADTARKLYDRARNPRQARREKCSNDGCGNSEYYGGKQHRTSGAIVEATTGEQDSMPKTARSIGSDAWQDSEWITGHDGKQRRIPESEIRLLADGFPSRNDLLRGFGNAIVPQVVVPIFEAIREIERRNHAGIPSNG